MWNPLTLEKKISSWKLMTSPFSSWIHPFSIKNCSIYNGTVFFFINLVNIWCLYVLWTIFEVNWTLQHQCLLGRGQRQFSRSQILIMGPVYKISQWNLACLLHKYSETSKPNFRGNVKFLLVHWPLEMYSNSMCRQPAPVCPAMGEIRYNTGGNPWQNEKLLEMHQNQQICLKVCTFTTIDHHNSELSMMCQCEYKEVPLQYLSWNLAS